MRRICMTALVPVVLASAFSGSAFAQVTYAPYAGQPVYVAQPAGQSYGQQYGQSYGQQYYVYVPQPRYATAAAPAYTGTVVPRYVPQTNAAAAPQAYAAAAPAYTGTVAPRYAPTQTYAAAGPQNYAAAAPAPAPVPAPAPAQSSAGGGGFLEAIFGGPTIEVPVARMFAPPSSYQLPQPQPEPATLTPASAAYAPSSQGDMSNYPIDPRYLRQEVVYPTAEKPGTIVIDTPNKFLYLVEDGGRALRYGIGVGRPGFTWAGEKTITAKREWPDWYPPSEMLQRRPDLPRYMPGGIDNPLGARAMYLGSTLYRIHGSNEPWTIGTNVSSGCIRMRNADVEDLYDRVKIGTKVLVI
jgi:lipoprotein-anchoring transpeptidase ErfK/SrfK